MNLGKFLAIAFMCHQRSDRSFFIKGKKFPICARCTGILIGYIVGIILAIITHCQYYAYFTLLLIPMIFDGGIQQIFSVESTNIRRLITGIAGGIGIIYIFISIHFFTVWLATLLLQKLHIIQ